MVRRTLAIALCSLPFLAGCVAPAPAPAPAPSNTPVADAWAFEMMGNINAQRAANGAGPLLWCGNLTTAAVGHSDDQAAHQDMTHEGSDGSDIGTRADRAGYSGWNMLGENVAYGFSSVSSVMTAWMNSPGHRANLLNASYTHVGLGRAASAGGTLYWTQDFGRGGTC